VTDDPGGGTASATGVFESGLSGGSGGRESCIEGDVSS